MVHSLTHDHRSFEPQARIDHQLAWGLGWGIEDGENGRAVWQWGNDPGYKNFVIGRPADRSGVIVLTNGDRGASLYADVVRSLIPGNHPSLERQQRPAWRRAMAVRPHDLKPRLGEPEVRSLLEVVAGHGNLHEVDRLVSHYQRPSTRLLGVVVETSWQATSPTLTPVACIGLEPKARDEAAITALAVLPDWRRQGVATSLIYGACEYLSLRVLEAETDAGALGFYRAMGFSVEPLSERLRSTDQYRCRLELPQL